MSLLDDSHYENLSTLVEDFDSEVNVHKIVVESSFATHEHPCPMLVFYDTARQKDYLVVVHGTNSFEEVLPKISEALHLYSARSSHSVIVSVVSKIALNDVIYDSLNFFLASSDMGYVYYLPFTQEGETITWHDDLSFIDELATAQMDQNGSDFMHLLHAHVHTDFSPFDAPTVLNYLSYHGFAIQSLNPHNVVSYIDMSNFDYQTVIPS
jgi:hypothetical protein